MQKNKRPTKLEGIELSTHLNIDDKNSETITAAFDQAEQVIKFVVGQDNIEHHDVSLVVKLIIRERKESA